jgi:hypothetical protein
MTVLWIILALILAHTAPGMPDRAAGQPLSWHVVGRGVCWLIAVLLMVLVAVKVLDLARVVG